MNKQLIVALDYDTQAEALALVDRLGDTVGYYKVGLELFLQSSGRMIPALKERNKNIFLDLKFHDIPNTVAAACTWAAGLGVDLFNVHASGGREMMLRAKEAVENACAAQHLPPAKLIAVTMLTSFDAQGVQGIGIERAIPDQVRLLAKLTADAGLDGVVCSPQEVALVQDVAGADFMTVCPGIRPAWSQKGDQKRTMTPGEAVRAGVHHIVVGRPITRAEDPYQAACMILDEMQS